jgi:hypothetical protein
MSDQPTLQFPAVPQPPEGTLPTRRRRGWLIALVAALAALVMLLPVGIYLALRGDNQAGPPGAAPSAPATSAPATSAPGTASPSSAPSATASRAPDGRIPLETLGNSTLTIPAWPADNLQGPSGRLRFRDGVHKIPQSTTPDDHQPPTGMELVILAATYGDLDRDGAEETVAEIGCLIEGGSKQLVAFDRTASGRIVTMGTVVATTGEIRDIRTGSARVSGNGVVTARLGDYQVCCGDETPQTWQDRGYRWYGGRFHQVSGPTRMYANPSLTETSVTTRELVLGPVVGGYRYGTLTVTVGHRWGTRPRQLTIWFYPGTGLERAGTAWPTVTTPPGGTAFAVTVTAPPTRGTTTHTFAFRRPATIAGGTLDVEVAGLKAAGSRLAESNPWNNWSTATIRTVG